MLTSEEIKNRVKMYKDQIKQAEQYILNTQNKCKHPNTFIGTYSYKVMHVENAVICCDCGKLIKQKR